MSEIVFKLRDSDSLLFSNRISKQKKPDIKKEQKINQYSVEIKPVSEITTRRTIINVNILA